MTALIELLTQARQAGLTVARIDGTSGEEDTLRIRGPAPPSRSPGNCWPAKMMC